MYHPKSNFDVPMKLLIPKTKELINGKVKLTYPLPEEVSAVFFASFRTFGGTENVVNGIYSIISTATIETWYSPSFKSDCRIVLMDDMSIWEIETKPENIERKNKFTQMKVKEIRGT